MKPRADTHAEKRVPPQPGGQKPDQPDGWIATFEKNPLATILSATAVLGVIVGVVLIGVYASRNGGSRTFAVGTLAASAAEATGMFAGFLFGLPRYNAVVSVPPAEASKQGSSSQRQADNYIPSNNLEQVSDWLTKILLGAGLVQLTSLTHWLGHMINTIASAFANGNGQTLADAKVFVGSILIFNAALGFPLGYVITTLWYARKLEKSRQYAAEDTHT